MTFFARAVLGVSTACLVCGLVKIPSSAKSREISASLGTSDLGPDKPHVFIFGLGYTGLAIASYIKRVYPACKVSGSCTKEEKVSSLRNLGINAVLFNSDSCYGGSLNDSSSNLDDPVVRTLLGNPESDVAEPPVTHLISTIPPVADFSQDPVLEFYEETLNQLNKRQKQGENLWLGYLSTTGVYGDHQGAWVDEESELRAVDGSRAYYRIGAERRWLDDVMEGGEVCVFRLAGIYGPGRSVLETVKKEMAAKKRITETGTETKTKTETETESQEQPQTPNFVNRIHVADIAAAVIASMRLSAHTSSSRAAQASGARNIYNLCDDLPAPREDALRVARALLSSSMPMDRREEVGMSSNEAARSERRQQRRQRENKRVSNSRAKSSLLFEGGEFEGTRLRFPTYVEGLEALHEGNTEPF